MDGLGKTALGPLESTWPTIARPLLGCLLSMALWYLETFSIYPDEDWKKVGNLP